MGLFGLTGSNETSSLINNCYSMAEVPGKKITKSLGLIQYTKKGISGDAPDEIDNAFDSLVRLARDKGGNAVVNVKISSGGYQANGSGFSTSYITVYGDAVTLN